MAHAAAPNPRQNIARILRRWDGIANQQLIEAAARLAEENDRLRTELRWAEDAAENWRCGALSLMQDACAATGCRPGITKGGALVLVPATGQGGAA